MTRSEVGSRGHDEVDQLTAEIAALGEVAAGRIVDQFAQLARLAGLATDVDGSSGTGDRDSTRVDDTPDLARSIRAARMQMERAFDGIAEGLDRSLDAIGDVAGIVIRQLEQSGSGDESAVDLAVGVDGVGLGRLWLHNSSDADSQVILLTTTALRRYDGSELEATLDLRPARIGSIPPGTSREIELRLQITGTGSGTYHGLVIGGPEPTMAVRVVVDLLDASQRNAGQP
jgi:hypothetical protein